MGSVFATISVLYLWLIIKTFLFFFIRKTYGFQAWFSFKIIDFIFVKLGASSKKMLRFSMVG